MKTIERIEQQIKNNNIIIYIKGTPKFPQCGFSAQAIKMLTQHTKKFFYINILEDNELRIELPKYANWPTFPQLWIKGELLGGCDIITELSQTGELQKIINSVL